MAKQREGILELELRPCTVHECHITEYYVPHLENLPYRPAPIRYDKLYSV
jgi:hypothetical protein